VAQNRDQGGRYASAGNAGGAAAAVHTPDPAENAGGVSSASSIAHDDDPGNLHSATGALLNRGRAQHAQAPSMGGAAPPPTRDFGAGWRALGYGSNEGAGQHQVETPEGRSAHGADTPAEGIPADADAAGAGAEVGGAEAAGAASGLAELAPLALL
jgi:hypothetical protein